MKGHIRERSPGHWAIVIDIRDPATGQRRRKWHSFRGSKRQAQVECSRLITEMERGTYLEPDKTSLAQFLDIWLADVRPRVSPKTIERYEQICRRNIIPLLGGAILAKLKPAQISTALTKALASGRRKGGSALSPRTVHHMHVVLKSALTQAVRWEMLTRNPSEAVKPPKVERATMHTYDMEQTAAMLDALRGTRMLVPVMLAAICGMRRGEIAALQWGRVDIEGAQLAVTHSAEQTKAGVRYKTPKSGRARTLALSATVVQELRAHKLRQAEELLRLGVRQTKSTFVCAREDGAPLQPNSLTIYWARLATILPLPRIRFHDLRHGAATHMLSLGIHPKIASERLGHARVGTTLDVYSHVLPGMQEDAAARVDDALQAALRRRS